MLEFHSNIKKINSVPNEISFTETIKNTIKLVYIFLVLSERNDLISLEILFYVRFDFTSRIETLNYLKKSNEQITIKDFEYQKFMISIYSYKCITKKGILEMQNSFHGKLLQLKVIFQTRTKMTSLAPFQRIPCQSTLSAQTM